MVKKRLENYYELSVATLLIKKVSDVGPNLIQSTDLDSRPFSLFNQKGGILIQIKIE